MPTLPDSFLTAAQKLGQLSTQVSHAVQDLVYPHPCVICGGEGSDSPFCDDCYLELREVNDRTCPRCAESVGPYEYVKAGCAKCHSRRLGFDAALALGPYIGPIGDICRRMKRVQNAWLARWMADLVMDVHADAIRQSGASVIVALPLHWRRRWKRGYNQAEALATRFVQRLRLPKFDGLKRILHTPKLAELTRAERAKMLGKSFYAPPNPDLKGRTVLLVDDILTTGATCGAAARALKRAGAARVIAVVVARA